MLEVGRVVSSASMSARWPDTQQVVELVILKAYLKVGWKAAHLAALMDAVEDDSWDA